MCRSRGQAENCKVRITICLDADILEAFKSRAAAAPYQTQINAALGSSSYRSRRADSSTMQRSSTRSPSA